jgi:hypothetical protein
MAVEVTLGKSLAQWRAMSLQSSRTMCVALAAVLLALACGRPAHADTTIQAGSVVMPGMHLQKLDIRLGTGADGQLHLRVQIAQADIDALGWRNVGVLLDGEIVRKRDDLWFYRGQIALRRAPGAMLGKQGKFGLILDVGANTLQLDIGHAQKEAVSLAAPLDQLSHVQAQIVGIPLTWLQGVLSKAWSGRLKSGRVSGSMAVDFRADGIQAASSFKLSNAGFDGGSLAGQGLNLNGHLKLDITDKRTTLSLNSTLNGGQALLGPVYAKLPAHATQLAFNLDAEGASMRLDHLRFNDPDALSLAGGLIFGADGSLHSISMSRFSAQLPAAYARYGETWLATLGLKKLKTQGALQGAFVIGADGPRMFRFQADDVNLADSAGRFRVRGLNGGIDWNRKTTRPQTALAWKHLALYRIPFGAASSQWRSSGGMLRLQGGLQAPVLGGRFSVSQLDWRPQAADGQRLDMASTVTGVDMQQLSKVLGWPQFRGVLAGAMPGLHYADHRVELDGGLALHVFDGYVDITGMSLQNPFGSAPELAANVDLRKLDLGAMTDVFDFGKITGKLDGKVDKLRLVDWTPVAFQARLRADSGGRISQRAVNNLTSVGGGGGVATGLQGAVMKLFQSFRYRRIGLDCTLEGKVCQMGGLKPEDSGYLIVEGSGLPHLTVIGHQRRVSWPTLVARLQAAIHGGGPVVK